jgi:hypothetical protein
MKALLKAAGLLAPAWVTAALLWCAPGNDTVQAAAPGPVLPDLMDRDTIKAIDNGLNYLIKTQRANGGWLNSGGYGFYPSVMTSLAGLSLMAGGSTPESGPYSRQVARAMNFMLKNVAEASNDGLIATDVESQSMYGHGFSMLFLAQCYGVETSPEYEERLRKVLEKAVQVTAKAQSDLGKQNNHAGGWTYTPGGGDEGSVTVTQLQALRACRNIGIYVPQTTIDRAVAYLKHCQMPNGGICYAANSRGDSRPAISAAAIACFYAAGKYDTARGAAGAEGEMVEKLVKYVKGTCQPGGGGDGHSFYTQFYMAQAMYQRGGNDWREYYPRLKQWLLSTQSPDGSWNGDGVGTTYGTALACIMLQLPYGYLPIYEK